MIFSRQSLEILVDLIEIKVSSLQIQDRDDARELNKLRKCRQELLVALNQTMTRCGERPLPPQSFQKNLTKNLPL